MLRGADCPDCGGFWGDPWIPDSGILSKIATALRFASLELCEYRSIIFLLIHPATAVMVVSLTMPSASLEQRYAAGRASGT